MNQSVLKFLYKAFLFCILILGLYVLYFFLYGNTAQPLFSNCEFAKDKGSCYTHRAEDKKDSSLCAKILNQNQRFSCYNSLAQSLHDINLCSNISDQQTNGYYCYGAIGEENIKECELVKLDTDRKYCYAIKAVFFRKREFCNALTLTTDRSNCYQLYDSVQ